MTEAACRTLVEQRLCASGIRRKTKGAKIILGLRSLVHITGRWAQCWEKVDRFGAECCGGHHSEAALGARAFGRRLPYCMIIAWRVLHLTKLDRDRWKLPCDAVFAEEERRAVYPMTQRKSLSDESPELDTMVRGVATRRGLPNRKGDGLPTRRPGGSGNNASLISHFRSRLSGTPQRDDNDGKV